MKTAAVERAWASALLAGGRRRAPDAMGREMSIATDSIDAAAGEHTSVTARGESLRSRDALAAATAPRPGPGQQPMLHVDRASGAITDRRLVELPARLRRGDVVVLNDAATIPASLRVRAAGRELELRLLGERADGTWRAVLFGEGSWRDDTDARPAPPRLRCGDVLRAHAATRQAPRREEKRSVVRSPSLWEGQGEGLRSSGGPLPRPLPEGGGPSPCSSNMSRETAGAARPLEARHAWARRLDEARSLLEAGPACARDERALEAIVVRVDPTSPRLIDVRFTPDGDAFWAALYRLGRPVQYSYLRAPLSLDAVQTPYAGRPFAVEVPSAGRPLTLALIEAMRRAGAIVVSLTHAAGLSATGDPALDARLPLPERYVIPTQTAEAIANAKARGHRVIAVGTSVTRALEGSARDFGVVCAGEAETDLRLGPDTPLRVVDAILTGAHDPSSSHHDLLRAFAPAALLERAVATSIALGYRGHELGDSWLLT